MSRIGLKGRANPAQSFKMVKGEGTIYLISLRGGRDEPFRYDMGFTYNESERDSFVMLLSRACEALLTLASRRFDRLCFVSWSLVC